MAKFYLKSHEWFDDEAKTVGISQYAAEALGDIVFVELPEVGDQVEANESFCTVESVKAVSELYSPVTGKIIEVNEDLLDSPESINADAESTWFVKIEVTTQSDDLMDQASYEDFCKEQ